VCLFHFVFFNAAIHSSWFPLERISSHQWQAHTTETYMHLLIYFHCRHGNSPSSNASKGVSMNCMLGGNPPCLSKEPNRQSPKRCTGCHTRPLSQTHTPRECLQDPHVTNGLTTGSKLMLRTFPFSDAAFDCPRKGDSTIAGPRLGGTPDGHLFSNVTLDGGIRRYTSIDHIAVRQHACVLEAAAYPIGADSQFCPCPTCGLMPCMLVLPNAYLCVFWGFVQSPLPTPVSLTEVRHRLSCPPPRWSWRLPFCEGTSVNSRRCAVNLSPLPVVQHWPCQQTPAPPSWHH
jgi:hypothetical protein